MMKKVCLSNLVSAMQIFLKYGDIGYPTHCEHDILKVNVDPEKVSEEDIKTLDNFGFSPHDSCFQSYAYGSA